MKDYFGPNSLGYFISIIKGALKNKQNKIAGTASQIVAFDSKGTPKGQTTIDAGKVAFSDGKTFQQKYDAGELTGPQGSKGDPGEPGQQGEPGKTPTLRIDENGHLIATY